MTLADQPAMVMSVGGLGEVASFLPQGLPDATIVLHARDNGTAVFPPPPPPPSPSGPLTSSLGAVGPTNASGVLVPIAPSIVVGNRAVFLTRFYAVSASADAAVWRPTGSLYLAAVDQRGGAVNRMWWAWQLRLPTDGTIGDECVPAPSNTSLPSPEQSLSVGGPAVMADASTVVIVLRCGAAAWSYGVQLPPAGSTVTPTVLWQAALPLPTAAAAGASAAPLFLIRFPGAEGAAVVWDASSHGVVATVDDASGDVVASTSLIDIIGSGVAAGRCAGLADATSATPVAPPLGSPPSGEQAHASYAVLVGVTTQPPSPAAVWLLGLQQAAANASITLQWCTPLAVGDASSPPQLGQLALMDSNGTRIVVSLPGGTVVALA